MAPLATSASTAGSITLHTQTDRRPLRIAVAAILKVEPDRSASTWVTVALAQRGETHHRVFESGEEIARKCREAQPGFVSPWP